MKLQQTLLEEINRRGLTTTEVADGAGLAFSTVSEFLRGVRKTLGADKAGKIADFLELELTISTRRSKVMNDYLDTITEIENRGYSVDDETVEAATELVNNLSWLENHGYSLNEDNSEQAATLVLNLKWLDDQGWSEFDEDDCRETAEFVANLTWLEGECEKVNEDRMKEVAQLVANLEKLQ